MYDYLDKVISIILSLMFVVNIYLCKVKVGNIIHPSILINFIWFVYTFVPLVLIFEAQINILSILYIYTCVSLFTVSVLIFDWRKATVCFYGESRGSILREMQSSFIFGASVLLSLLGVIFALLTLMQNGWSMFAILTDLLAVSGRFAAMRGNEGMVYGLTGMLGTLFTYTAPLICGLMFTTSKSKSRKLLLFIIAVLPGIFTMVIQSSKFIFLISILFFVGALLLARLHTNRNQLISTKNLVNVGFISLFFIPFILFSVLSREHYGDLAPAAVFEQVRYAFNSYVLGQIYAFSDFFSYYLGMPSKSSFYIDAYSYGAYTFYSILNIFGFTKEFPSGLYVETGYLQGVFETNVFTIFRGVLNDFGLIGSFVLFGLLGFLVNYSFYKMLYHSDSIIRGLIFVCVFVAIGGSYLFSVFMARYMFSTLLLAYIVLTVNKYFYRHKIRG